MQITTTRVDGTVVNGLNKIDSPKPKPILRTHQYHDFKSAVDREIERHIKNPLAFPFQNCLNCVHWKHANDLCGLYNSKPPAEIIVYSCPSYADIGKIPY